MSAGDRSKWDYLTDMHVYEFLNYLAYLTDKAKYEGEIRKKAEAMNKHGR